MHLRVWLGWSFKAKLREFLLTLVGGEEFTAQGALAYLKASNQQAVIRSVSLATTSLCNKLYALCMYSVHFVLYTAQSGPCQ